MLTSAEIATANTLPIRKVGQKLAVGWNKTIAYTEGWFTLDESVLDGPDLLGWNADKPFNPAMAYELTDISAYTKHANLERGVQFPYAVQSATADFELINDQRSFSGSPYLYPARPLRWWVGIAGSDQTMNLLPLFDGFTNGVARYSGTNEQSMSLTAMDLLALICDRTLPNMYMATEVRTDEIIRSILVDELGVGEYLLNLEQGDVVIPFVWWEAGKSVANALKSVVQAENGRLWVDEQGYICFSKTGLNELTTASVASFDSSNIISATTGSADRIVNECHITAGIREVQPRQMVYSEENENGYQQDADEDTYRIAASTSTTFWIQLEDPCTSIDTPLIRTARSDVASYFVATNLSGTAVASGLSIEEFLVFGNRVMLTIANANAYAMSLREIKLWGTPARVVQEVDYTAQDDDSINSYGRKLLEITDNELWGTAENVRSYARTIVQTSAAYEQSLTLEVRSNILLQVGDVVEVQLPDWNAAQRFAVETIKLGIDSPKNCAIKQTLGLVATAEEE